MDGLNDLPITISKVELDKLLSKAQNEKELFDEIVNAPFQFKMEMALLFLGIIVLLLVDKEKNTINRVALSKTNLAKGTLDVSVKRFEDIKIPLNDGDNLIANVIRTKQPSTTTDWQYLFTPVLTPEQARLNQAGGAIGFSCVYPLNAFNGGALIFSYFHDNPKLNPAQLKFMDIYTKLVDSHLSQLLDPIPVSQK